MKRLIDFLKDEEGATAIEYAIMLAAIAASIVVAVDSVGNKVDTKFTKVKNEL